MRQAVPPSKLLGFCPKRLVIKKRNTPTEERVWEDVNQEAFTSIRSGGLPGSIKVIFGCENERMEISAHVYNMNTYAKGMNEAGVFLKGKRPGLYTIQDVFIR
jgi:4-hydroxy-tetrahydrodipicolinate reductase